MVIADAILCLGTQFNFSDVPVAKGNKSKGKSKQEVRIIATSESSKTLEARTASILGTKFLSGLTRITIDLSEAAPSAGKVPWQMQGLVSHAPSSPRPATARDLQFFSINGRPVDLPAVSRILGDVWRGFDPASAAGGARRRPACVWAFTLPRSAYDVNLAPDKREVMFTEEATVAELVRLGLTELWSGQCEGQFAANEVEDRSNPAKSRGNGGPSGGAQATDGEGGRGVADKSTSQSNAQEETALAKLGVEHDDTTPKLRRSNTSSPSIGRLVTPADEEALQDESGSGVTPSISKKKETSPAKLTTQEMAAACCGRESPQAGGWDRLQLPERARQQDRRGWEQKQLNFQKTERKQLQQDLDSLFSSAKNVVDRGRNNTLVASKTSPAKTALATESVESHMHSKDQKYQNHDVTSFLNKLSSRSTKVVAAAREKAVMRQSAPKGNTLHNERNTRMVIGRTAISDKPQRSLSCEPVAEKANLPSSRSPSKEDKHDNGTVPKRGNDLAPPPDEVEWSAFQGTQDVMAQYKSARVMMHETRQSLRKSAKRKREDADGGAQTAENSAEKSATVNLFKEDFPHMTIIGQFNLGFILALCRNNKLWILDQHACDEIYNFERLCKDTVMHEQKLIAPLPLDLSPSEENCVLENMDIFERNGFRFSYDCDKGPRHRLSLTALPHSGSGGDGVKSVQFGVEDVGALCAMLGADGTSSAEGYMAGFGAGLPAGGKIAGVNAVRRYAGVSQSGTNMGGDVGSSIVRLPKAVGMFANRACRVSTLELFVEQTRSLSSFADHIRSLGVINFLIVKQGSIMIGDALSHKEQTAILKNLYTTDNPWSCAHGRPTMSHIRSLAKILMEDDDAMVAHVAGPNLSVIRDD